jgi:hypothetical protein
MKMLTKQEVEEKIQKMNEYLTQEKELQEELLRLEISGTRDLAAQRLRRHDEILEEIEEIRMKKMMPIIDELAAFVAYCQKIERGEIELESSSSGEKDAEEESDEEFDEEYDEEFDEDETSEK